MAINNVLILDRKNDREDGVDDFRQSLFEINFSDGAVIESKHFDLLEGLQSVR